MATGEWVGMRSRGADETAKFQNRQRHSPASPIMHHLLRLVNLLVGDTHSALGTYWQSAVSYATVAFLAIAVRKAMTRLSSWPQGSGSHSLLGLNFAGRLGSMFNEVVPQSHCGVVQLYAGVLDPPRRDEAICSRCFSDSLMNCVLVCEGGRERKRSITKGETSIPRIRKYHEAQTF